MSDDDDRWLDGLLDAAHEAHIEEVLDDNAASVHAWLEEQYRKQYRPGQTETCFEAVLACQNDKAPLPEWLVEALKAEIELAVRRPLNWPKLEAAAREANRERQLEAQRKSAWYERQAEDMRKQNAALSVGRIAELVSKRAEGTEFAAAPRTIRRHLQNFGRTR
jgi:hypothetical protein